jgi:NAD(P)-dependent dehydrogenase (short-subunit alcohol dehydrogenase family)
VAKPKLAGKVVVVTGASAGVGRAIARRLGQEGARVALLARNEEALRNAAREIRPSGGDALVLAVDVANAAAVDAAADAVVQRFGRIDLWVNDAMVSVFSPVMEMTSDEFRRVTEVTYLGVVHGTRAALRHMLPRDDGHIIQIGSALAYRSIPLQSAYCAAKAAVRGFTDSVRCELHHDDRHVKLSTVHLPAVNTPQFDYVRTRLPGHPRPVAPIFQPELIAEAVLHVARRPRRELWVGWPTAKVILGQRVIPGLLDRYLGRIGYAAQQAARPPEPGRPDNLDAFVPGDRGARGEFSDEARSFSPSLWVQLHRRALAAAVGLALVGAAGLRRVARSRT